MEDFNLFFKFNYYRNKIKSNNELLEFDIKSRSLK